MQNAKDTFYITLRDRLTVFNPSRTIVLRGAVRPAMVVAENELVAAVIPVEAFVLSWADIAIDSSEPLPLHSMLCDIAYTTRGTTELLGMDRGRVLDAMDGELRSMLQPASAVKQDFGATPAAVSGTNIFWSAPRFGAVVAKDGQLARRAQVSVFALQEAGD
jgi:hypothetical protein